MPKWASVLRDVLATVSHKNMWDHHLSLIFVYGPSANFSLCDHACIPPNLKQFCKWKFMEQCIKCFSKIHIYITSSAFPSPINLVM